jgi:spore maturation protein CgeB
MRFLLLNTDYRAFVEQMYERQPGLADAPYDEQLMARNATFFGVGDAYTRALRSRGHDAHDIHMNNPTMQAAWVRENGPVELGRRMRSRRFRMRRGIVPWLSRGPDDDMLVDVLAAQVAQHRPEVVLNHDISWVPPDVLRRIVGPGTLLIGQHAAPPYPAADYTAYDLIVSSWPPTIRRMRAAGIRAEHLGLGFDPAVLEQLGPIEQDLPLTFVGSLSELHTARTSLIETLCQEIPEMRIFAPSARGLPRTSPIHHCYAGPAYGLDMFRVLARSQVTINHHGFPEPHANNMRLFEATGVGTLLLTDNKPDLVQYFNVGSEVMTYNTSTGCLRAIVNTSPTTRDEVAASGQRRTLAAHTWDQRISELLTLL